MLTGPNISTRLVQATEICKALVLQLAYLSNARVPINRLPSEIFDYMLLFLKDQPLPFPNPDVYDDISYLPSLGLWHRTCLVCRRWRHEVLNTQELWTTIRICDKLDAMYQWTVTWQSRSGVLPLTAIFYATPTDFDNIHMVVWRSLAETHRVSHLYVYEPLLRQALQSLLMQVADHLETFFLISDGWNTNELKCCELPQLQVLSVARSSTMGVWSTRKLRHLSLGFYPEGWMHQWREKELLGFLATLEANTQLEELMLRNFVVPYTRGERWKASTAFPKHRWPIRMPKLKRLFIERCGLGNTQTRRMGDVLDQTLSLPPTCTRFYVMDNMYVAEVCGKPFPFERIAVSSNYIVGTDGVSACILKDIFTRGGLKLPFIDCAQVRELWLQGPPGRNVYDDLYFNNARKSKTILDLQNAVKLVIQPQRLISLWLQRLEDCLPALKELQILMQYHDDRQAILRFLAWRKQNGLQVDTLHFIGDPASDTSEAFNNWKEDPQEFRDQVDRVIFEEVRIPATGSHFKELVSTRLGLPEACKHWSPVSELWQPWTEHVFFD